MVSVQTERAIEVSSPLGKDALLFRSMSAIEELGRIFDYRLELLSDDHNIKLEDVLGQSMTVTLETPGGDRFFNGFVSEFSYMGIEQDRALYHASLRPWLWFLTRTRDCRIFQKMTVPDIVKQVFQDAGFTDFEDQLTGNYREWDYCVQYRETAHDFVSRLMEQEGIYFYFKHADNNHTLVLADGYSAHDTVSSYEDIPFYQPDAGGGARRRDRQHVFDWRVTQHVQPGAFSVKDFDFEKPSADLEAKLNGPDGHAQDAHEIYDYPAEYKDAGEGETYVRILQEQHKAAFERVDGQANARGITVGSLFKLTGFPREDQNREYLVVQASYTLSSDTYRSEGGGGGPLFSCGFEAIESSKPYRSPPITPKTLIRGPQTAIVVGKSGDEIFTDKYGQVKVQFHWDRYGESDENSSCWVRVAQIWAGKTWGGIHIPRVGQEVIVEFLEGDPDRPIITGRVYNAEQMPPYDLPANATQSGIKSRSSKGGSGADFNEFRFEDKKGSEEVYLHAQKDWNSLVENDQTTEVQHDRSTTITNNDALTVGVDRTMDISNNETNSIGMDRSTTVSMNDSLTAGMNRDVTVGANDSLTVGGSKSTTVTATITMTAGGGVTITAPMVTINAPMVSVAGVLQCTNLITSVGIVSPVYSPGVGNII